MGTNFKEKAALIFLSNIWI